MPTHRGVGIRALLALRTSTGTVHTSTGRCRAAHTRGKSTLHTLEAACHSHEASALVLKKFSLRGHVSMRGERRQYEEGCV